MKVKFSKTNALVLFRINEKKGTEEDETEQYFSFSKYLVDEFIPFHSSLYCFIGTKNDDALWCIKMNKETYHYIKTKYDYEKKGA